MPSGHPPAPNSIIVGNCTACNGLVRVSATANATAQVRCPHCQETFPLIRLLESVAPEVEVVDSDSTSIKKQELYIDQGAKTATDASGKFVVPSQLAKGARRRKSSRSRSGSSSSRSSSRGSELERPPRRGNDSTSPREASPSTYRNETTIQKQIVNPVVEPARNRRQPAGGSSVATPPRSHPAGETEDPEQTIVSTDGSEETVGSHRSTRHRDARAAEALNAQPNRFIDFLKVIAGACLALPIAYLIVMWVFTKDPLGVGVGLGEKLPFLVPASLRAEVESDADGTEAPNATGNSFLDLEEDQDDLDSGLENWNIGGEALRGL